MYRHLMNNIIFKISFILSKEYLDLDLKIKTFEIRVRQSKTTHIRTYVFFRLAGFLFDDYNLKIYGIRFLKGSL